MLVDVCMSITWVDDRQKRGPCLFLRGDLIERDRLVTCRGSARRTVLTDTVKMPNGVHVTPVPAKCLAYVGLTAEALFRSRGIIHSTMRGEGFVHCFPHSLVILFYTL